MSSSPLLPSQFVRIRASSEAVDVVTFLEGSMSVLEPGAPVFGLRSESIGTVKLCNVARAVFAPDGPIVLARESVFFWPKTASTSVPSEVFWADPANELFTSETKSKRRSEVSVRNEKHLLRVGAFHHLSDVTRVDTGVGWSVTERRHVFLSSALGSSVSSILAHIEENRVFPLTPKIAKWLGLTNPEPQSLVLVRMTGAKLAAGLRELPSNVRTQIDEERPEFAFAPTTFFAPNTYPQLES